MYILGIDPTAAWTSDPEHLLGELGMALTTHGSAVYKYVRLRNEGATVAVVSGSCLGYLAAPASTIEVGTVVSDWSDASAKVIVAGVAGGAVAGVQNTAYYGWVQQTGYVVLNVALGGTVVAGDAVFGGATGGTDMSMTLVTAVDDPVCAYAHVDATKNVRLMCV